MHRDPTLRKRNALVIPGVLLVLVCLAGIVYAQGLRSDDVECEDGRMVVFAGDCRSATLLLTIPLALGLLLVILGARLRGTGTCHLGHGTIATTGLAILLALVVLPLLAAGALMAMEDPDQPYVMTYQDIEFGQARVLAGVGLAMTLLLVPYLALYIGTARPRACCRDKGCFEPCFCDEDTLPPDPAFPPGLEAPRPASQVLPPPPPRGETAQVTTTAWTGPPKRDPTAVAAAPPVRDAGTAAPLPPAPKEEPPRRLEHDIWPETHRHDSTFDQPPAPAAPAAATPAPLEPEPGPPAATSGEEPAKAKHKKAPAKKGRKVAGTKKKR